MEHRPLAIAVTPVHRDGQKAPSIYVNADSYGAAVKIAAEKCHLFKTYPKQWGFR